MYGILALFTGHPLDVSQWIFYIWSVFCLIVFMTGLRQVYKPNLLTNSMVTVIFSLDTIISCIYCLWFTAVWFSQEDQSPHVDVHAKNTSVQTDALKSAGDGLGPGREISKRAGTANPSQSASSEYEFFFIMLFTLIPLALRFYFNFIIIAFEQQLLRSGKFSFDQNDVEVNLHNRHVLFQWKYKFEKWCYYLCKRYL